MSTLEAVARALQHIHHWDDESYNALLRPLRRLCQLQLQHGLSTDDIDDNDGDDIDHDDDVLIELEGAVVHQSKQVRERLLNSEPE